MRDDVLTISVEQNEEKKEECENYIRREGKFGSFSRSFYVGNIIAPLNMTYNYLFKILLSSSCRLKDMGDYTQDNEMDRFGDSEYL